jgi:DNA-binding XRE family transcriptional regulator
MNIRIVQKNGEPEWVIIPYETYLQLVEEAELFQDLRDYDLVKSDLESGDEELIPSEVVYAILDGGNPIKIWREFRQLTQKHLAEIVGISTPYLSQIETGKRTGTAEVLNSIAKALQVTLDEIIFKNKENSMTKIIDVEGIGPAYAGKMKAAGVATVETLLKKGATTKGRKELAEKSGISEAKILEWVNHADLFRVKGIGSEYSDLLEAAGVDTVPELAQRKAENLFQKLVEVNKTKKLVRRLPVLSQVENWIDQAKRLPRVIQY